MSKKISTKTKEIPLYGTIDERTKSIVYQGDAYTGRFMLFAILLAVVVRGLPHNLAFIHQNWDLMFIVFIGGAISTGYQLKNKVIFNRPLSKSVRFLLILMGLSALGAMIATKILN